MENHDLLLLTRKGRVKQLPGEHERGAGEHEEDDVELAALCLVNREGVGEFQAGLTFFAEVVLAELEDLAKLAGELDFDVLGIPVPSLRPAVSDDHPDLAICEVAV